MARPKKRPTTITEFEKQKEIIPTHEELHAFREAEKKKYNTELQRQSNHKDVAMQELYTDYNIEPSVLQSDQKIEEQIEIINTTISRGDESAMLRLQEIQEGYKLYKKKVTQFLKARENIKKNFEIVLGRIDTIEKRFLAKKNAKRLERERQTRATVEYVDELSSKVDKVMALRRDLKLNINYERKITWLTAEVEEMKQELFKIKGLLKSKGFDA